MEYSINPQAEQDSIEAFLKAQYPHIPIIPDGVPDTENELIQQFPNIRIKPFMILWYSTVKRRPRGRSFGGYKLDSHFASLDILIVTSDPTVARTLMNDVSDRLVGFRTEGGGRLYKSPSLWGQARSVDMQTKPTRWAMTDRFDFGVASKKVAP